MPTEQRVALVPSRPEEWARRFAEMSAWLSALVPGAPIEHIGSTAVRGLPAKDVVDLLVGVDAGSVVPVSRQLAAAGLDLEGERDHHCWLSAPSRHARTHVVHVVELGGHAWTRRVAFRDLLRQDPDARETYLAAKRAAAAGTPGWDAYTQAKTQVVAELLAGA
ncbi:GrpB family protein [Georgenia faecalis]|uniref:GrpB family protein n=1 Tax=Georgenia faecalis TaxID=2483799 RepID=UPI0013DFC73A|nr:GrpB family protein [Georgenia faecalis]